MYQKYFKRLLDIIMSFLGLITLAPLFIVISIVVKIKLGSPVIFKQQRPGLNERIFTMYKFRTMADSRDADGELLPDSERLTKLGQLLRKTSLDELPELINIFRGDMSIVGPRPLLVEYLELYNKHQKIRHNVKPGLTGLAQVNGRNSISWEKKFNLDVEYVRNISLIGDFKIVLHTIRKVLLKEDISSDTSVTMEKFTGSGRTNDLE